MKGKFIVYEGLDGSGKTTQVMRMVEHLRSKGMPCRCEKEPTDGVIGSLARNAVKGMEQFDPVTLALLFAADRAEHVRNVISPALERGEWVVCDRYVMSNIAYQSISVPAQFILDANQAVLTGAGAVLPDVTIFIDTAPKECADRISSNRLFEEMFDRADVAMHVRRQYNEAFNLLEKFSMSVRAVHGDADADEVFAACMEIVDSL